MSTDIEKAGLQFTDVERIPEIVVKLRNTFMSGKTRDLNYRKKQLKQLAAALSENTDAIVEAVSKDLGRSAFETKFAEILGTTNEIVEAINNLDKWAKPEKPFSGLAWLLHSPTIRKEPKGTVLVLGAWNYSIAVQIGPMIGAIAAGNTVLMKPSEVSPNSAKLIAELFAKYMDPESYTIVNGGVPQATALLDQRWEHIFYTGNGNVGRIVAEKAAKWLCPVSLELGGKSPTIVDDSADFKIAAHRILWGKAVNCGQTCIAPDYVLVTKKNQDKLVEEFKKAAAEFWPQSQGGVVKSDSYGKIVNANHFKRLHEMVGGTRGEIVLGNSPGDEPNEATKFMAPTVIKNVSFDDSTMRGEIFGPVLPIVPVDSLQEAVDYINSQDQPLALYMFSGSKKQTDFVFDNTRSGQAVQGETLLQYAVGTLPFGGTGPSGYGSYHGREGFNTFTHLRSGMSAPSSGIIGKVVEKTMSPRYPPYNKNALTYFKLLVGKAAPAKASNPHVSKTVKRKV